MKEASIHSSLSRKMGSLVEVKCQVLISLIGMWDFGDCLIPRTMVQSLPISRRPRPQPGEPPSAPRAQTVG
jgi:hypothetical protein